VTDVQQQPYPSPEPPFRSGPAALRPRRRGRVTALIAVALVLLIGAGTVSLTRHPDQPQTLTAANATTPQRASDGYYKALISRAPRRAFDLLCSARRAAGYAGYGASVSQNVASGTGIKSWRRTAAPQIAGDKATVAGQLVLDDGDSTPITLALLREGGTWRICTSDLGGILPGPGGAGSTSNA